MRMSNTPDVSIRPAEPADIPAIRGILAAYGNDDDPATRLGADIVGPYVTHLIAHHRALLAETAGGEHDGFVVAYGAVTFAGSIAHLADLFVRDGLRGQGIGTRLLRALFADTTHRTTFASDDPRAMPSYVRAGMLPRWPLLYLDGSEDAVGRLDPAVHQTRDADPLALATLEALWTDNWRPADHAFWASQAGADAFVVIDGGGEPVALGYGRSRQLSASGRALDRLVVAPDADPVATVAAAIRRVPRGGSTSITLPGPHPALPMLLRCGFRITNQDTYMAGPADAIDLLRLLPNNGML